MANHLGNTAEGRTLIIVCLLNIGPPPVPPDLLTVAGSWLDASFWLVLVADSWLDGPLWLLKVAASWLDIPLVVSLFTDRLLNVSLILLMADESSSDDPLRPFLATGSWLNVTLLLFLGAESWLGVSLLLVLVAESWLDVVLVIVFGFACCLADRSLVGVIYTTYNNRTSYDVYYQLHKMVLHKTKKVLYKYNLINNFTKITK